MAEHRPSVTSDTPLPSVRLVTTEQDAGATGPYLAAPLSAVTGHAGRNVLFGEIARGGMGAVLRGRDPGLGRDLAVKVLLEGHHNEPEMVRRFLEEAQIAGQLQHPGVVPVYELGRFADDRPFFSMKLVKGDTLADLLQRRSAATEDLPRFLSIFEQICQTVAYAHAHGVIHRDLKPGNVMVGSFGEVQVMDWGLAKVLARVDTEAMTSADAATAIRTVQTGSGMDGSQAGSVLGTPAYMPPEQASGASDRVDERADVFGLGGILCTILTGQPPYRGQDRREVQRKAMRGDLADAYVRLDGCGADGELIALARACLALESLDRPRDAGIVALRVVAYQAGVQVRLRRAELERAAAQVKVVEGRKRRKVTLALAVAVLALVAVGGLGGLYWQGQRAELARQDAERRLGVEAALAKAVVLREQAHWAEARAVLEQADNRLGATGPADLRQQVQQASADVTLMDRLEGIRLKRLTIVEGKFDNRSAQRDYPVAFREAGLTGDGEDAAVVAERIQQSAIRTQLVAALDDWASIEDGPERQAWLLQVARLADPDPWGDRFRDPLARANRTTLVALATELLADQSRLERMHPATLAALAQFLPTGREQVIQLATAQALHPNDFWLNFQLGNALREEKRWDDAVGYYRAAVALRPDAVAAHTNLGNALYAKKDFDAAIQEYRAAIALDPKLAPAHTNLGNALHAKQELGAAIQEYRAAIALDPKYAGARYNLGSALGDKQDFDAAIQEYRAAIALDPKLAPAHTNLGNALRDKKEFDAAIQEYRAAIALDPKDAPAHYSLGIALQAKQGLDAAIQEFRAAIALDPKYAEAHCNLGHLLRQQGQFAAAVDELRKGHELGSQRPGWPYPSALWVKQAEQLLALDRKLTALLDGNDKPADDAERLALADLCQQPYRQFYAAAARFYAEVFAHAPKLAGDLQAQHRYNAVCAAALAGCGVGKDTDKPDDKDRARLRQQAFDWLNADLAAWTKQAASDKPKEREAAEDMLKHWLEDADLAGVRDKDALDKLPEAERTAWRKLWDAVAALQGKVQPGK